MVLSYDASTRLYAQTFIGPTVVSVASLGC